MLQRVVSSSSSIIYVIGGHISFEGGSLDWKSEVLVPFLRITRGWRATDHSPLVIFSQKHQIGILG